MESQDTDHDSSFYKPSREELEEALRWLEELTTKKELATELGLDETETGSDEEGGHFDDIIQPNLGTRHQDSVLSESPFQDLLESGEDDIPDWLREVASTADGDVAGEMESRLDWLAKMAQRESIEELPTLEWRRFPTSVQEAILPKEESAPSPPSDTPPLADLPTAAFIPEPELEPAVPEVTPDVAEDSVDLITDEHVVAPESIETHAFDDLDAAMAWIEELAANQEGPVEDLPSVADRALASKLLLEVGLHDSTGELNFLPTDLSALDDLESQPAYIADEDPADTIVLVETMAADSGQPIPDLYLPSEAEIQDITEDVIEDALGEATLPEPLETEAPEVEMSFEEAIAYLEELAQDQQGPLPATELSTDDGLTTKGEVAVNDETTDLSDTIQEAVVASSLIQQTIPVPDADKDDLDDEEAAVREVVVLASVADERRPRFEENSEFPDPEVDSFTPSMVAPNGNGYRSLETKLQAIDSLALPRGKSLDDIDARLRSYSTSRSIPTELDSHLPSILDWLEESIVPDAGLRESTPMPMDDEDIIRMMPEDPDEALAWLVMLAAEEGDVRNASMADISPSDSSISLPGLNSDRQSDVSQMAFAGDGANLLEMPEDPDEAMIWLESLADEDRRQTALSAEFAEFLEPTPTEQVEQPAPVKAEPPPRRPSPSRRSMRTPASGNTWVDLLKPLDK